MQFVRQSKFRHVFAKPLKSEFCLNDVRITKISWDSMFCSVNPKFLAVICEGSGGPFMVIPLKKTGRVEKDYPKVDAHKAPCLEVAWCPFNDNIIASGSEDTTVKVWKIPECGLVRSMTEPVAELLGHQRRVTCLLWHPSASDILLSAGADLKIFLWNVATSEALIEIAGHPDLIWSVSFNYNGSRIVTTCKDKKLRVIDPRSGKIIQQGAGHEGVKPQRAVYLRDGRILTTGFTKRSERMYALRDEEALEEPIVQEELDTSNGVLFPLYDPDTGMLYLAGKGDSQVRYYEINNEPPFVHYVNVFTTPEPQRGMAFMPKRGLNVNENEIARIYKCTNKGLVEVLQFFVPRKSELFQDDLYPDTPSLTPAITADEWVAGKDADPVLMPVMGAAPKTVKTVMAKNVVPMSGMVKRTSLVAEPPSDGAGSSEQPRPVPITPTPPREASPPSTPTSTASGFQSSRAEKVLSELRTSASKAPSRSPTGRETTKSEFPPPTPEPERREATTASRRSFFESNAGAGSSIGRTQTFNESGASTPRQSGPASRQSSVGDMSTAGSTLSASAHYPPRPSSSSDVNLEEMILDIQKLKAVVRRHEKRIRYLEEQLAERDMVDLDGI